MCRSCRIAVVAGLSVGFLAYSGCSETSPAPATIEGKAPADYREEMEKKINRPFGDPPPKSSPKKNPGQP